MQRQPKRHDAYRNRLSRPWPRPRPMQEVPLQTTVKENPKGDSGMSPLREVAFVLIICTAQLCPQAGIGQVLPILHVVGAHFGNEGNTDMSRVIAGYCAVLGTVMIVAGRLGEVLGYKRVFLAGFFWSAVWSAIVGGSYYSSPALLLASRALQGLGLALSLPNGLALLGCTYTAGKRKAAIFALYASMSPIGLLAGAAGASAFTLSWWPLTYWAFALVLLLVVIFGFLVIPNSIQTAKVPTDTGEAMRELDVPGMITCVSCLVLIGFAWNQAAFVGWQQPYIWVAVIVGCVLGVLFVLIEGFNAPKPLIPFQALPAEVLWVLVAVAGVWSSFGVWIFYTWQFVLSFRTSSPFLSTAYFSPLVVAGCLAVVITGLTLRKLGPMFTLGIASISLVGGSMLIVNLPVVQAYWGQLLISMITVGLGLDISIPAATLLISTLVDKRYHGVMANVVSAVTYYSIAIGLGIAGTIESNILKGIKAALLSGAGMAAMGLLVCATLAYKQRRQRRKRCCNCHGVVGDHHQI
ncbi:major facilitator superfamily-domain-containing protein [Xylariaceae sp. FL0016]|nr:major facilitator superfamily-domain-containing protein [Xylariaceae sp. FL0016]